jgi:arylformamidase
MMRMERSIMADALSGFDLAPQPPLPSQTAIAFSAEVLRTSRGGWPGVREDRDRSFGPDAWQTFDVFAPRAAERACDIVVFFHGGGWTNGYKEWCGFMAPAMAAHGVILVAPRYRLAPAFRYPVFLEDSFAALAAIRAQAAAFGGDPERVFLAGHSAGGHIAALLGLRTDLWPAYGIPAGAIRGCLPVSAILDLHHPAPPPGSMEARVYELVLNDPADDRAASPVNWLDRLTMPLACVWGENDTPRVHSSNERAIALLRARGAGVTERCYAGLDHFQTQLALADATHDWYALLNAMRVPSGS